MSYQSQNVNVEGGMRQEVEEVSVNNQRNWNAVLVAAGLGLTGLFAVSASGLVGPVFKSTSLAESQPSVTATTTAYSAKYDILSDDEKATLFTQFKTTYSKQYATTEEENERFENFKTFLSQVDTRNLAEGQEVHDITKFADLTPDEFKQSFLGFQMTEARRSAVKSKAASKPAAPASPSDSARRLATSSDSVNWYMISTTAVKNQGYCGSCWAFSATEQVESDSIAAGILTTSDSLSPQQIVSCAAESDGCYGCDGGDPVGAYEYIESAGGLEPDSDYPYESYYGDTETCDSDSSDAEVTVTGYTVLDSEDEMISYVSSTGPLSVCLDASTWGSYTKGVVSVCGKDIDHCVQATGINTESDYWIVRNSWGTDWGLAGFIYLKSGADTCGITYLPSYTATAAV
jgi:C1A family cysteine protease